MHVSCHYDQSIWEIRAKRRRLDFGIAEVPGERGWRGELMLRASVLRIYFRFNQRCEAFSFYPTASDEHRVERYVTVLP